MNDALHAACVASFAALQRVRLSTRITHSGREPLSLVDGYVPLLVDYTEEDREARGLRKLQAGKAPRVPVHDTMLETADREPLLLLTGPTGCGKSTSLQYLALHLAGATLADPAWSLERLARPVARNDAGTVRIERWRGPAIRPLPIVVETPDSLQNLLAAHAASGILEGATGVLLLVDRAERMGEHGEALLVDLAALVRRCPTVRAIVAGESEVCRTWRLPAGFVNRRIVPLIDAQRSLLRSIVRPEDSPAGAERLDDAVRGNAGLFTLALETGVREGTAIDVVDRWLADASMRNGVAIDALIASGVGSALAAADPTVSPIALDPVDLQRLQLPFLHRHLAARHLRSASPSSVGALYRSDPLKWSGPIRLLARRVASEGRAIEPLLAELLDGDGPAHGAIDAVRIVDASSTTSVDPALRRALRASLVAIVQEGRLPVALREEAGRALATDGDPRDLDRLIDIAGGPFTMGSTAHANSAPAHGVTLAGYRIGRYPVTNDRYRRFVDETGRAWRSTDGLLPHRSNSPAVDLTWRDARAYCDWLTPRWRADGRIAADAIVRLPSEPEWERAARGLQHDDGLVYPWGGGWHDDRSNSEEAGFNDTCTVGLFPRGRSPEGCDDMAGQVWEWTTTLWGEDMATPRFAYPYVDDGREDPDAPADVRRVLRGGCFLSPREKANCIYRGSLEPDGYWRGNGFRIVVAPG